MQCLYYAPVRIRFRRAYALRLPHMRLPYLSFFTTRPAVVAPTKDLDICIVRYFVYRVANGREEHWFALESRICYTTLRRRSTLRVSFVAYRLPLLVWEREPRLDVVFMHRGHCAEIISSPPAHTYRLTSGPRTRLSQNQSIRVLPRGIVLHI